jgi:hypothetical protein
MTKTRKKQPRTRSLLAKMATPTTFGQEQRRASEAGTGRTPGLGRRSVLLQGMPVGGQPEPVNTVKPLYSITFTLGQTSSVY